MIITALLNVVYAFVYSISLVVGQFGDVTSSNAITDSILTLKSYYVSLDMILPLTVLLAIIAFDLAFEGFVFAYKMIRWAYTKVPSIN